MWTNFVIHALNWFNYPGRCRFQNQKRSFSNWSDIDHAIYMYYEA